MKESTVNTEAFKSVLGNEQLNITVNTNDKDTDELVNGIMQNVAVYITKLAKKQIKLAFEQSEKEVQDLHQRTSEGLREAKRRGKQVGRAKGKTIVTKKSKAVKELIKKYNKAFGGTLNDIETIAIINGNAEGVSRNIYYKYES